MRKSFKYHLLEAVWFLPLVYGMFKLLDTYGQNLFLKLAIFEARLL